MNSNGSTSLVVLLLAGFWLLKSKRDKEALEKSVIFEQNYVQAQTPTISPFDLVDSGASIFVKEHPLLDIGPRL